MPSPRPEFTPEERARYGWPSEPPLRTAAEMKAARTAARKAERRASRAMWDTVVRVQRAERVRRIRRWHPGQVAVLCIGSVLAWLGARSVFREVTRWGRASDQASVGVALLSLALMVAIPTAVIVVLWIWFGGRPQSSR